MALSILDYHGRRSTELGIVVETLPNSTHGARRGETYRIAGRNGRGVREEDTFDTYDQIYEVWMRDLADGRTVYDAAREVAAWLLGTGGYTRLEDSYEPEYYRLARFAGPLDIETKLRRYGRAKLVFECQPERFLKSGEQAVTLWENLNMQNDDTVSKTIRNPTAFDAAPLIRVVGKGSFTMVKPAQRAADAMEIGVSLGSVVRTLEIDCASYAVNYLHTVAGAQVPGDASFAVTYLTQYPTLTRLTPGDNTVRLELYDVSDPATLQKVEIVPRWWTV